jgi:hypothetical protein
VHIGNRGKTHGTFSFRQVRSCVTVEIRCYVNYLIWVRLACNTLLW